MEMRGKGALNVVSHVGTFLLNWGLLLLILFGAISQATAYSADSTPVIKAVYKLSVLNDSLVSREQIFCVSTGVVSSVVEEHLCPSGFGRARYRMMYIKTQYPPGVLRIPNNELTSGDTRFTIIQKCMNYSCDGDYGYNGDLDSSNDDYNDNDDGYTYVVGLAVASPCCTSEFTTFLIIPSSLKMVQSTATTITFPDFEPFLSCTIHQVALEQMTSSALGLQFPVKLYLCGALVSTIVSEINGRTLLTVLTAVISTNRAVSRVLFPREVLRAISGWISDGSTESGAGLSLHDAGACVFVEGPEEHMSCAIPLSLQNNLPILTIEVQRCNNRLRANSNSWAKIFCIDLNKLVDKDGFLRIWSSGSVSEALQRGAQEWEIPRVVVGALFLQESRITVTRNPVGDMPARGLPVLLLESESSALLRTPKSLLHSEERGCGSKKTCTGKEVLFTSLNRCGMSPECGNTIAYHYDGETLQCKLNVHVIASLSLLSALVIVSDVVVLLLQWHVEKMMQAKQK
ncbi:hypothetical protein LSM04_004402 [Trypanosoma melophagium]|uniref:uncharacterized protein n=1 Tax=Trypanosoma melophagium TaxID=715481 RepID=UPI00351A512D|nr:hypothetical protein LSM04_004402 [Trypanosoma melophagium]